jgi:WD40 repeat protein
MGKKRRSTTLPLMMLCLLTAVFTACISPLEETAVSTPAASPSPTSATAVTTPTHVGPTAVPLLPSPTPQASATNLLQTRPDLPQPDIATATPIPPTATPTTAPAQIPVGEPLRLGRGQIVAAVFLPDGDSFAIAIGWAGGVSLASPDGTERWWQPTDALLIALDAAPQGDRIAAVLENGAVALFTTDSGAVQQFAASRPYVYWSDIAFAPGGERLAFQSIGPNRGDPIYLLDLSSGELTETPRSRIDSGALPHLAWSPDGQTVTLSALGESCARLLDAQTGEVRLRLQAEGGCYAPWAVAYAPDGQQLALAAPDGGVDIIQWESGQKVAHLPGSVLPHPDQTVPALLFSPDGRWLASTGGYSFYGDSFPIVIWEATTGVTVAERFLPRERRVALTFAGDTLLTLYEDGRITRWAFAEDGAGETAVAQIPVVAPHLDFRWSADGRRLAAPLRFGGAAVWGDMPNTDLLAHFDAPLTDPALSPDGRFVALFNPERREISLYEVDSGANVAMIGDADFLPYGDPFSPDGRWLAYGTGNRLGLAAVSTGETAVTLGGYPADQKIARVLWSPGSDALVAASAAPYDSEPGRMILWEETAVGEFVAAYQGESVRAGYSCCVTIAAFNPSGSQVAFELLPVAEASSLLIELFDRQQAKTVLQAVEYELVAWISDDLLLIREGQYDTRLTQWRVADGEMSVLSVTSQWDTVFAPGGLFSARVSADGPNIGRGIRVGSWLPDVRPTRVNFGNDIIALHWSPNGRWLAALGVDNSLWVWPVMLPEPGQ